MTPEMVVDVVRDGLLTLLIVAGPLLLVAMAIGLLISIVQALTQIQEMTLTFVPKIVAMFGALLLFLPFMIATLTDFMNRIADQIVGLP
ncbi:MAG: flagellar biosynthesis protein FliQ [Alphaproteobacteria bacterium]|nr:flagellar biosynthesis protein FliQ [Alphaproteobacteria bacterium]